MVGTDLYFSIQKLFDHPIGSNAAPQVIKIIVKQKKPTKYRVAGVGTYVM